MRSAYRLAVMAGLVAFSPASLEAADVAGPADPPDGGAVRVINNYIAPVKVYVEDADGKVHELGRVRRSHAEVFEISSEIAGLGAYRIKVFPNEPAWAPVTDDFGVRTRDLALADGEVLNFWVEPDLTKSKLEFARG